MAAISLEIQTKAKEAAAKINVTKPLDPPQAKPFRSNLTGARNIFEKDNNETNELKNKRVVVDPQTQDEKKIQNGNNECGGGPPKPLPRVSRTGSLSEEEAPKPRPRTNSTQPIPQPPFICSINISAGYKVSSHLTHSPQQCVLVLSLEALGFVFFFEFFG